MRVRLALGPLATWRLVSETGRDILVQTDGDVVGVASVFGWVPCRCRATDGTIDCEHRTADEMIADASVFLDEHFGEIAHDPGYF